MDSDFKSKGSWVLAGGLGYCFSLVSPQLVLGPSGVLQGIRPGKCYVDMSTVDADTVTELAQVIVSRGGRFLEAPVSGNQQLSNDGMLVILAAGDRGLYEDCSSCFQAMGKTSFFLGEVGNAAKMMLIVNMVQGSFMATIAEGLTLAQVTGQSQQTFLDILNQGQLASIFLDQKCQNILQGNFKPDFYLKYIQKDLRLAIALGDAVNHPTPMAAAANEVTNCKTQCTSPSSLPFFSLFFPSTYFGFSLLSGLISQGGLLGH
uniref:Glyoxylate reductase 1-like protein n=1 Tax=Molossus molossus TaxID=27622 RepID=A0A7J8IY62_MOLMO|nr:glyoxylate reductase 1-like protein [Molossus molossus]